MAFRKKESTSDEVFCLTLPLRHCQWQRDRLDVVFQCCNNIKNALIAKELRALRALERKKKWKVLKQRSLECWKQVQELSKVPENETAEQQTERERLLNRPQR